MQLRTMTFLLLVASILALAHAATGGEGRRGMAVTVQLARTGNVAPGFPAALPGMKPDDQIIELNGLAAGGESAKEMYAQLRHLRAGDRVRIRLQHRDGVIVVELSTRG